MDGAFWMDTRTPFMVVDNATISLAATNKAVVSLGNLPVLGPSYFNYAGKGVRLTVWAEMTTGATPGNLTFSLWWGNGLDVNGTNLGQNAGAALTANVAAFKAIRLEYLIRCRALGTSGVLLVGGTYSADVALIAGAPSMITPSMTTVDLTQNFVLSPQVARSGSTAESFIARDVIFEALN